MKKSIALILSSILGMALLIFTSSRFLDLIPRILPANQQLLGYFGLAGFEGGLLVWLQMFRHGARGHWQRGISFLMVVVCLVGIGGAVYIDLQLDAGANGVIVSPDKGMIAVAIAAIAIIIMANVIAVVGLHLTDPDAMHASAEEEAKANITALALKHIHDNSNSLAAELAPQLAARWVDDMRAQHLGLLATPRHMASTVTVVPRELPTADPQRTVTSYANDTPLVTPPPQRVTDSNAPKKA